MPPPLPASLSERLKLTIDPLTGSCKHHPSIQLCQLVANGTRWSIKRKVCIKCGSRTPVGGFNRRQPGKSVSNPGRPAPGKLNPEERAEAARKEREDTGGTLKEREARRLLKELEESNNFADPPPTTLALVSSDYDVEVGRGRGGKVSDSGSGSSDDDRFNIRHRSASRPHDNYRSRDSNGRDVEQEKARRRRSVSRPRDSHRSRTYDHIKGSTIKIENTEDPSFSRTSDGGKESIDDEPRFDERRLRTASRPRDRSRRDDGYAEQQGRRQRSVSRPREHSRRDDCSTEQHGRRQRSVSRPPREHSRRDDCYAEQQGRRQRSVSRPREHSRRDSDTDAKSKPVQDDCPPSRGKAKSFRGKEKSFRSKSSMRRRATTIIPLEEYEDDL